MHETFRRYKNVCMYGGKGLVNVEIISVYKRGLSVAKTAQTAFHNAVYL